MWSTALRSQLLLPFAVAFRMMHVGAPSDEEPCGATLLDEMLKAELHFSSRRFFAAEAQEFDAGAPHPWALPQVAWLHFDTLALEAARRPLELH